MRPQRAQRGRHAPAARARHLVGDQHRDAAAPGQGLESRRDGRQLLLPGNDALDPGAVVEAGQLGDAVHEDEGEGEGAGLQGLQPGQELVGMAGSQHQHRLQQPLLVSGG